MPSLAEVHGGSRNRQSTEDDRGVGEPVSAEDAAQFSVELSATGVVLFLLGIGIAFFFDSVLGTVSYLALLGLAAYVVGRWLLDQTGRVAGGPRTPTGRAGDRSVAGVLAGLKGSLGGSGSGSRSRTRRRRSGPRRYHATPLARVGGALRAYLSSLRQGGDRL